MAATKMAAAPTAAMTAMAVPTVAEVESDVAATVAECNLSQWVCVFEKN